MKIYFKKSFLRSEAVKQFVRQSSWYKQEMQKKEEIKKSLTSKKNIKKAGFPIGTMRVWKGKKYMKVASNKWVRQKDEFIGGDKGATQEEIKAFLSYAMEFSEKRTLSFGLVTDEAKERIKEKLGEDKDVKRIILDSDAVRHAMKEGIHKIELEDLEKIGEIVNTTKNISLTSKKHLNNIALRFVEEVENGINLIMEFRNKKGNLALVTAYRKEKKGKTKGNDATMLNTAPALTSETLRSSSDENVSKSDDFVNKKSPGLTAIRAKYEMSKTILGRAKTVVLPDGSTMKCHYRIVEADAPSASHNEATFEPTPGFPTNAEGKNVNDRDYQHDTDEQEAVKRLAANFNALSLDSPPIVTKDGIVICGNKRTMAGKLAARSGADNKYLDCLHEMADEFGINEGELADFEHPRVILEVDAEHEGEYTTKEFEAFNQDTKKTMNNDIKKAVVAALQQVFGFGESA